MTDDLTDLEATARAATPGEWEAGNGVAFEDGWSWVFAVEADLVVADDALAADAAYIAAANPAAILALIERLRRAEGERDRLRRALEDIRAYEWEQDEMARADGIMEPHAVGPVWNWANEALKATDE